MARDAEPIVPIDPGEAPALPEVVASDAPAVSSDDENTSAVNVETELDMHPLPLEGADEAPSEREYRYGNGDAQIVAAVIRDLQGRARTRLRSLETYEIHLTIAVHRSVSDMCFGILLRDARGIDLFGADSYSLSGLRFGPQQSGTRIVAKARFRANLAAGQYFLTLALANLDQTKYDLRFDAIELTVEPTPGMHHSSLVNLEVSFTPETHAGWARTRMLQPDPHSIEQPA